MNNKILRAGAIIILTFIIIFVSIFAARKKISPVEDASNTMISEENTENFSEIVEIITEEANSIQKEETATNKTKIETTTKEMQNAAVESPQTTVKNTVTTTTTILSKEIEDTYEDIEYDYEYEYAYSGSYPVAAQVWNYLRAAGWSKAATAGAIGNMMLECGGWTMDLQPYVGGDGYYGLCQWYLEYANLYYGASVEEQLAWLVESAPAQFSGYGYYNYINLTDPGYAAIVFANYYERCADWAVAGRDSAAWEAYNYFA